MEHCPNVNYVTFYALYSNKQRHQINFGYFVQMLKYTKFWKLRSLLEYIVEYYNISLFELMSHFNCAHDVLTDSLVDLCVGDGMIKKIRSKGFDYLKDLRNLESLKVVRLIDSMEEVALFLKRYLPNQVKNLTLEFPAGAARKINPKMTEEGASSNSLVARSSSHLIYEYLFYHRFSEHTNKATCAVDVMGSYGNVQKVSRSYFIEGTRNRPSLQVESNFIAIRNILNGLDDTFQELSINVVDLTKPAGLGFYLTGLFNGTITRSSLKKLVLANGTFNEYTATEEGNASQSITQIEMKGKEIESSILTRLSSQFIYLKNLKPVSTFTKFPKDNIIIEMPDTSIESVIFSDNVYDKSVYNSNETKFPKFNLIVLIAVTSAASDAQATRYSISSDFTHSEATTEITENVFGDFASGGVTSPTLIKVKFQSIKRIKIEKTATTNRKVVDITLL